MIDCLENNMRIWSVQVLALSNLLDWLEINKLPGKCYEYLLIFTDMTEIVVNFTQLTQNSSDNHSIPAQLKSDTMNFAQLLPKCSDFYWFHQNSIKIHYSTGISMKIGVSEQHSSWIQSFSANFAQSLLKFSNFHWNSIFNFPLNSVIFNLFNNLSVKSLEND